MERTGTERTFLAARSLKKLTKDIQTPFYLYDEKGIRAGVKALSSAFSRFTAPEFLFPVQKCTNRAVLELLWELGCSMLCRSRTELLLMQACGFCGSRVVYGPTLPNEECEELADQLEALRLVEGEYVLPPRPPKKVLLSYNPGGKLFYHGMPVGNLNKYYFGMNEAQIINMADRFATFGAEEIGLTLLTDPLEGSPEYYAAAAQLLFELCVKIREACGVCVNICNLGDGLPYLYDPNAPQPDLTGCAEQIEAMRQSILLPNGLSQTRIGIMPGRYLVAHHGLLLTRVCAIRQAETCALLVDAALSNMMNSLFFGGRHRISVLGRGDEKNVAFYDVIGATGDRRDSFGKRVLLPIVKVGDILVLHTCGADGSAVRCGYGGIPNCAEYVSRSMEDIELIRPAQSGEELLQSIL